MVYAGKLQEKRQALKLRGKGLSYGEILRQVDVSKDTLSRWCRDVILTPEQLDRLREKKLKGAERGRIIGAKRQQQDRIKRTKKLIEEGRKEIGVLSKRDRFVAGISLYLGDGYKNDKQVGFSDSNASIIKFMMSWFREFCRIPEKKYRGQIWIHDNLDEKEARRYWSSLTNIPLSQFHKSYISENKVRSRKIRKKLHKYGVFAVKVHDSSVQRKILGWMAGVLGEPLL